VNSTGECSVFDRLDGFQNTGIVILDRAREDDVCVIRSCNRSVRIDTDNIRIAMLFYCIFSARANVRPCDWQDHICARMQ
jgi:hypothetical protein